MTTILDVAFRLILDSRGNPTVECDVEVDGGLGRAAAPSGASTGAHEVPAWPDGGVDAAVRRWDGVRDALVGLDAAQLEAVDEAIAAADGTPAFGHIGGAVAVAASLACARAAANAGDVPLWAFLGGRAPKPVPFPMGNVLGGGAHAIGGTDIQEFMAVTLDNDPTCSVFANAKVHRLVGQLLKKRLPGTAIGKGDEGAWVAPVSDVEALEVVADACHTVADETGVPIRPALDVAATELWDGKAYAYKEGKRATDAQIAFLGELVDRFSLWAVEDPLHEDDFEGFAEFTRAVGSKCLVVGDDLYTTSVERLLQGIQASSTTAILIKPNQIGSLTRTAKAVQTAHGSGLATVMSHRSGETPDDTIAHLAVAFGCRAIKTGAVGGERVAKLNELIRIHQERQGV